MAISISAVFIPTISSIEANPAPKAEELNKMYSLRSFLLNQINRKTKLNVIFTAKTDDQMMVNRLMKLRYF
jgi:hypothetical protein